MVMPNVKDEAQHLIDNLPENATWDDVMDTIYVRQAVESGIEDSDAGRCAGRWRGSSQVRTPGVKVFWTDTAVQHLLAIYAHIAQDAPRYGRRMVERLTERSQQIAAFPHSGRVVPEYGADDVREVIERPYRIIYRIKPEQIDVLAVVHGARMPPVEPLNHLNRSPARGRSSGVTPLQAAVPSSPLDETVIRARGVMIGKRRGTGLGRWPWWPRRPLPWKRP